MSQSSSASEELANALELAQSLHEMVASSLQDTMDHLRRLHIVMKDVRTRIEPLSQAALERSTLRQMLSPTQLVMALQLMERISSVLTSPVFGVLSSSSTQAFDDSSTEKTTE